MSVLLLGQDSDRLKKMLVVVRQALPQQDCQILPADKEFELEQSRAALIFYDQDENLVSFLRQELPMPVIVAGTDLGVETRCHALRLGAAEYVAHADWNPDLIARVAHYALEVHELKQSQAEMVRRNKLLMARDLLTGVLNRAEFLQGLPSRIDQAQLRGENMALILLKLHQLRDINQALGLAAGDAVLKVLVQRVAHVLRGEDELYRMDGNVFSILMQQPGDADSVRLAANRIREALERPMNVFGQSLKLHLSMGAASWPSDADSADALVLAADVALKEAQKSGQDWHQLGSGGSSRSDALPVGQTPNPH